MILQYIIINSLRIQNLRVRGFKFIEFLVIDCVYIRDFIFVDCLYILERKIVICWLYLKELINELLFFQLCEVGFLIGYNCFKVFVLIRILMGKDNQLYGIQIFLGWSVVGYIDYLDFDVIVISY